MTEPKKGRRTATSKTSKKPPQEAPAAPEGGQSSLEGLDFLEDEQALDGSVEGSSEGRSVEVAKANQEAALRAIRQMEVDGPPTLESNPLPDKYVKVEYADEKTAAKLLSQRKVFRVTQGGIIAAGGSRHTFRIGKVFTNNEYDVDQLRQQGIEVEEVQPAG